MHADHSVRLSGAHSQQRTVLGEDDGVGLDVFGCLPGEGEVLSFGSAGNSLRNCRPLRRIFRDIVGALHQHPAGDRPQVQSAPRRARPDGQDAQVTLPLEDCQRVVVVTWGYDHLVEDRVHLLCGGCVHGAIDGDDPSEGADRVSLVGQLVCFGDGVSAGQAAGVVVLDDGHRRLCEIRYGAPGGVGVHQVVVGEFAPVQLRGPGDSGQRGACGSVESTGLVRVLAVPQAWTPCPR